MSGKWNAGDEVIVEHANYRRGANPEVSTKTISRVARKYFYIDSGTWRGEQAFEIATGREKDGQTYYDKVYTPAEWETKQIRDGILAKVREHKVGDSYAGTMRLHTWSVEHLQEFLGLLDRVKAATPAGEAQ